MTNAHYTLAAVGLLVLGACGGGEPTANEPAEAEMAGMDHPMTEGLDIGRARGTVVSVAAGELGIDHGPIEGIGMGAMTMMFGTMAGVDAEDFREGDKVAFMVERGRDGVFRISAICNTADEGDDCLAAAMDHEH